MRAHEFTDQGAAGIVLYAEDTGRYCLQQRSNEINDPGLWAAWGGGREPGETLEQCARRELAEESGYTGPIKLKRIGENARYVTFLGTIPHEFEPVPCDEWQDYCWVEAGDWPGPMHPGTAAALKNIPVNENMDHSKDGRAVEELRAALIARKNKLQSASDDQVYDIIDRVMTRIAKSHSISGQQLHDMWVDKYKQIPDTWIMNENFADGKNPGRKGLAKRVGVNCKQPVSKLRSIAANSSGERQRMAHWCANMKSGKKKANEEYYDGHNFYGAQIGEDIIGHLHFPNVTIAVDDHAIERTQTHGVDPHSIDVVLKKLSSVADELNQLEVNNKVWVYDPATNVALGLRRISSREPLFKLKTVVGDRPYNGQTPIINL